MNTRIRFWLDQVNKHGDLLTVRAVPDQDHMGCSAGLRKCLDRQLIVESEPGVWCLTRMGEEELFVSH